MEAGGLAVEIARLRVELRRQLTEVRAARARIVAAGDAERRRVQRDLHDGAQQRLVAIGLPTGTLHRCSPLLRAKASSAPLWSVPDPMRIAESATAGAEFELPTGNGAAQSSAPLARSKARSRWLPNVSPAP